MWAKIQNANSENLLMELQSRQVLKTLRAEPTETSPSFCIRDRVTPCISTGWMPTVWVATLLGKTWGTANEHQVETESTVWCHHIKAKPTVLQNCGWQTEGSCLALLLAAVEPHLEHYIQVWVLQFHGNAEKLERFSWKVPRAEGPGARDLSEKTKRDYLVLPNLKKRRLKGG